MTRSKLKQTRRQRDEKGHVVVHQTRTEQQLGGQAREILKVADVSTDHVRKLQSKLDRKRWISTSWSVAFALWDVQVGSKSGVLSRSSGVWGSLDTPLFPHFSHKSFKVMLPVVNNLELITLTKTNSSPR